MDGLAWSDVVDEVLVASMGEPMWVGSGRSGGVEEVLSPDIGTNGSGVCLVLLLCAMSGSVVSALLLLLFAVPGVLVGSSGNMIPANLAANGMLFSGDLHDTRLGREFEFMGAVTNHQIRHYEIDARGELVLRLVVGLGYAKEFLHEVIMYVTNVHEDVPDAHVGAGEDIVESMMEPVIATTVKAEETIFMDTEDIWKGFAEGGKERRSVEQETSGAGGNTTECAEVFATIYAQTADMVGHADDTENDAEESTCETEKVGEKREAGDVGSREPLTGYIIRDENVIKTSAGEQYRYDINWVSGHVQLGIVGGRPCFAFKVDGTRVPFPTPMKRTWRNITLAFVYDRVSRLNDGATTQEKGRYTLEMWYVLEAQGEFRLNDFLYDTFDCGQPLVIGDNQAAGSMTCQEIDARKDPWWGWVSSAIPFPYGRMRMMMRDAMRNAALKEVMKYAEQDIHYENNRELCMIEGRVSSYFIANVDMRSTVMANGEGCVKAQTLLQHFQQSPDLRVDNDVGDNAYNLKGVVQWMCNEEMCEEGYVDMAMHQKGGRYTPADFKKLLGTSAKNSGLVVEGSKDELKTGAAEILLLSGMKDITQTPPENFQDVSVIVADGVEYVLLDQLVDFLKKSPEDRNVIHEALHEVTELAL
ncbi:hypothetical protein CBR_g23976 [Chara braunii]|uniref:Uncharacterized protein n=1 Tax=Chara braunii TaxID=69332 RepID=A0A388L5E9_CHABU|nr:hypothetical protein CBR_g23976 [Chara braunii]|eukprot:GBG77531.1 hypothetical protein CBR_g23976 [Chara braunii]